MRSAGDAIEQDNGTLAAGEELFFFRSDAGVETQSFYVAHHDGKGLAGAALSAAKLLDGGFVGGITGEMEAADAFDGDDGAGTEQALGFEESFVAGEVGGMEMELRAAARACNGLGVEAAVERVAILGFAVGTHGEAGHGGERAIVGKVVNDGEARAAVGAIDEGIAVAAVGGIKELGEAVGAGGDVWRDGCVFSGDGMTVVNGEGGFTERGDCRGFERVDAGEGRRFLVKNVKKFVEVCGRSFCFNDYAERIICDEAADMAAQCSGVNEGAESDALHYAGDVDLLADCLRHGSGVIVDVLRLTDRMVSSCHSHWCWQKRILGWFSEGEYSMPVLEHATSTPQEQLQSRLADPRTVDSLNRLLDHLDTISASVEMLDSFLRRGNEIADNVAGGIDDVKKLAASVNLEQMQGVAAALPKLTTAGNEIISSGLLDQVSTLSNAGMTLAKAGFFEPKTVSLLAEMGQAAANSYDKAKVAPQKRYGIFDLLKLLNDPAIQKTLNIVVEASRQFGSKLNA
jgi:uncharacterized protein YjgD (DUF1641 family)